MTAPLAAIHHRDGIALVQQTGKNEQVQLTGASLIAPAQCDVMLFREERPFCKSDSEVLMTDRKPQGDFAAGERAKPQGPPRDFAEGEEREAPGPPRDFAEGEEHQPPGPPRDFAEGNERPNADEE